LLVEHPPTLTLGRRGRREDVLWTDAQLAVFGIEICETPRGGQTTLHAPGQLVAYPVVPIGLQVRVHVTNLGACAVALLAELGVAGAEFRTDPLGVWIEGRKVASIGVHVSRGVTVQGIAINLDVDPRLFLALVSCGMPGVTMTNAVAEGARGIAIDEAARRYAALWGARTGRSPRWRTHPTLTDA
jgi:lipoate-protein ligase B